MTCRRYAALLSTLTAAGEAAGSEHVFLSDFPPYQAALHALREHAESHGCLDPDFERSFPEHAGIFKTVSLVAQPDDSSWIFAD